MSKVSSLSAAHGRLLAGAEQAGIFESRDAGATWKLLSSLDHPAAKDWNDPSKQPPGHLGVSAITPHPGDGPEHFWAIVQGYSLFETTDDGKTWTARNEGIRADWPREYDDIGFCVHKHVFSPDVSRMYQQNHCGMYRSDDGGQSWTEIGEGLPSDFGFAASAHPHDRDTFYVIPLDPGHARTMHDGKASVWRTRDAGSSWQRMYQGLPQEDAYLGVLRAGMTNDRLDSPGFYFGTSTGQVFGSIDEGESWSELAGYLPAISSVEVAVLD